MATRRSRSRLPILALMLCAAALAGCAQWRMPQIDPSGEHFFVPAADSPPGPFREVPPRLCGPKEAGVVLTPGEMVAQVGSEVVAVAGVLGEDAYLTTNAKIEWTLAPGGVGQFVSIDESSWCNYLVLDFTRPRKISDTFAIGTTSRQSQRLTRGTPDPQDDVYVLSGQTWISVTSPVEGTSYVTAYSPDVRGWDAHQRSTMIHWVDGCWAFPPATITPAGTKRVFTTTITRRTTQAPVAGWLVRYQILDGPPAGFSPDGATVVEVPTNPLGQASVEIFQKQPAHGTNRVAIQVIRPEPLSGQRYVVGSGLTSNTWSAPQLSLVKAGPAMIGVGASFTYRIQVSNAGDQPAEQVVLIDELPPGATYLNSNPVAESDGQHLRWGLGTLAAGTARVVEVNLRADRPGSLNACAEATSASGLRARNCISTTVTTTPLTSAPAPCTAATSAPTMTVPPVTPPPAAAPPAAAPPASPPPATAPPASPAPAAAPPAAAPLASVPPAAASIELVVNGPDRANVGDEVTYQIIVTNRGTAAANGLVLLDRLGPGLLHEESKKSKNNLIESNQKLNLAPGQSETMALTFRVTQSGALSHTVMVRDRNKTVLASKQVLLTAVAPPHAPAQTPLFPTTPAQPAPTPPAPTQPAQPAQPQPPTPPEAPAKGELQVRVAGPPTALDVGKTAKFTIEVSNPGTAPLSGVHVVADLDPSLEWTASTENKNPPQWTIATLPPGGAPTHFDLECRCVSPASQACVQVRVTAAEGATAENRACFEIRAVPIVGVGFTLTILDTRDPITVDKEETYIIVIKNGPQLDRNVVLSVTLPKELLPDHLKSNGPTGGGKVEGQTLQFDPVPQLFPNQPLEYRVVAKAMQPGRVEVKATVHSQNIREESRTEKTEILPRQ